MKYTILIILITLMCVCYAPRETLIYTLPEHQIIIADRDVIDEEFTKYSGRSDKFVNGFYNWEEKKIYVKWDDVLDQPDFETLGHEVYHALGWRHKRSFH